MALSPIVAQAILQQRGPDVLGSFQKGREQQRSEQARALTGEFLQQQGISGTLGELAGVDSAQAVNLAQVFGIPLDQPGRLTQFANNARLISETGKLDQQQAFTQAISIRDGLQAQGIETPRIDEFLQEFQVDPQAALSNVNQITQAFVNSGILQPTALEVQAATTAEKQKESEQKQVNALRKDITGIKKSFNLVEEAKNRIDKVGNKATAASDLALIFNFMKMLDPGSTVREGEFATAQNATGVEGRIVSLYNNLLKGTRLNTTQRADFLGRVDDLFAGQQQATDDQVGRILDQGVQDQIRGERILGKKAFDAFTSRRQSEAAAGVAQPPAQPAAPGAPQFTEGQTATGPDGQKIIFRNGQWEAI
ncbi:hypothetical protein KAR91_09110 [Candidatus Pacearchaeota archaeon]|nr:hypothetical protein [Candidatus Pacearchaeota archaeon]